MNRNNITVIITLKLLKKESPQPMVRGLYTQGVKVSLRSH